MGVWLVTSRVWSWPKGPGVTQNIFRLHRKVSKSIVTCCAEKKLLFYNQSATMVTIYEHWFAWPRILSEVDLRKAFMNTGHVLQIAFCLG